ncbi:MAG: SPASM domain-containing protein [Promethearchaeota archaeon]
MKNHILPLRKFQNEERANLEEIQRKEIINSMPVRVTLDTNKNCNLLCKFCGFSTKGKNAEKDRMKLELLDKISKELFCTACEIVPTTCGEPLLYEHFDELLQFIGNYFCRIGLYTNGKLLDEGKSRKIIPFINDLKVSFDASSKSTYEALRLNSDFDTVLQNIETFNRLRNNIKYLIPPTITLHFTLMKSNIEELTSAVILSSSIGINRIATSHVYMFKPEQKDESLIYNQSLSDKKLAEAYDLSVKQKIDVFFPRPFKGCNKGTVFLFKANTCSYLYKETWISSNGDVHPCFIPDSPVMGNVYEQTFKEIWNGSNYRDMRRTVNSQNPAFFRCKNCPIRMQFDSSFRNGYNEPGFQFF